MHRIEITYLWISGIFDFASSCLDHQADTAVSSDSPHSPSLSSPFFLLLLAYFLPWGSSHLPIYSFLRVVCKRHFSHALCCSVCFQSYKGTGNTDLQDMTLYWGAQRVSSHCDTFYIFIAASLKGFSEKSLYVLSFSKAKNLSFLHGKIYKW